MEDIKQEKEKNSGCVTELFNNCNLCFLVVCSTAIGVLFFISILGMKIINPENIAWLMQGGDWPQHFLGWHFFRNEPWQFPLGKLSSIQHPVGASIGYTDSIPLMAILLKLFANFLPDDFQYIGIWLLLCFCLQGLFAALLIRTITANFLIQLLGAALFIISPILLARIGHPSLCSQWILLAALWLYFRNSKSPSSLQNSALWFIIIMLSAALHPGITIMTLGLAFAFYLQLVVTQKTKITSALLSFGVLPAAAIFFWWIIGYFEIGPIGRSYGSFGYGYFSMNLLAPLNPIGWSGASLWSGTWSTFQKAWPAATIGQAEGFNYLGIGIIVLTFYVLLASTFRRPKPETIKFILPLVFVCVCFTLVALSNKITLSSRTILEIKLNHFILATLSPLRSSGRFFWPVYYSIIFLIITFVIRRNTPKTSILILSLALAIQLVDFHNMYEVYDHIRHPHQQWNNPLTSNLWSAIGKHYKKIILVPPRDCAEEAAASYIPFAYYAANNGMTINTFYLARYNYDASNKYCGSLLNNIKKGTVEPDSVYILSEKYLNILLTRAKEPILCEAIDSFNVCISTTLSKSDFVINSMNDITSL